MTLLEPSLVRDLASSEPLTRMQAALKYARLASHCDAALLLCRKPTNRGFNILVNDGYPIGVARFFASSIDSKPEFSRAFRRSEFLSWEDTGFASTFSAEQVLQPAGFHNGMTIALQDATSHTIGSLVVNKTRSAFPPDEKEPIRSLVSVFASLMRIPYLQLSSNLSPRERDVIELVARGLSNPEIAHRLLLSPRTVATHVENIFVKLGVTNRVTAVVEATRLGLLEEGRETRTGSLQ